jgi:hypothetical protein
MTVIIGNSTAKAIIPKPSTRGSRPGILSASPNPSAATSGTVTVGNLELGDDPTDKLVDPFRRTDHRRLPAAEPVDDAPILDLRIRKGVRRNGVRLAVASARPGALDQNAQTVLRVVIQLESILPGVAGT